MQLGATSTPRVHCLLVPCCGVDTHAQGVADSALEARQPSRPCFCVVSKVVGTHCPCLARISQTPPSPSPCARGVQLHFSASGSVAPSLPCTHTRYTRMHTHALTHIHTHTSTRTPRAHHALSHSNFHTLAPRVGAHRWCLCGTALRTRFAPAGVLCPRPSSWRTWMASLPLGRM